MVISPRFVALDYWPRGTGSIHRLRDLLLQAANRESFCGSNTITSTNIFQGPHCVAHELDGC
jgi:hypothetical protein